MCGVLAMWELASLTLRRRCQNGCVKRRQQHVMHEWYRTRQETVSLCTAVQAIQHEHACHDAQASSREGRTGHHEHVPRALKMMPDSEAYAPHRLDMRPVVLRAPSGR